MTKGHQDKDYPAKLYGSVLQNIADDCYRQQKERNLLNDKIEGKCDWEKFTERELQQVEETFLSWLKIIYVNLTK